MCLGQCWCVPGVPGMRLGCVLEHLGCALEVSLGSCKASWEGLEWFWDVQRPDFGKFLDQKLKTNRA